MKLKEKLKKLLPKCVREKLQEAKYDVEFEDHPIGNQNVYRLYFIEYYKEKFSFKRKKRDIVTVDRPFEPFMLPDGMKREDAFKVLSYLADFVENEWLYIPCSFKSVAILEQVIDLKRLGFTRLSVNVVEQPETIDLFTVTGIVELFMQSEHYDKYFEWYTKGVTFDEVKAIYSACGIDFYNPIATENGEGYFMI